MRKILTVPDPRLRKLCADIEIIDKEVKKLAAEMLQYVQKNELTIGLAAPQVGELIKLFVIDMGSYQLTMINPKLVKESGTQTVTEGCESIPGRLFITKRPKVVKIRGLDLEGKECSAKGHDILAVALIHELQHLHGILVEDIAIREVDKHGQR